MPRITAIKIFISQLTTGKRDLRRSMTTIPNGMENRIVRKKIALERSMADVQAVVELGRRLRADNDLKVRQTLAAPRVALLGDIATNAWQMQGT